MQNLCKKQKKIITQKWLLKLKSWRKLNQSKIKFYNMWPFKSQIWTYFERKITKFEFSSLSAFSNYCPGANLNIIILKKWDTLPNNDTFQWLNLNPRKATTSGSDKTDYSHRKQTMSNHAKINKKAQEKLQCNREKRKAIPSMGANLHWDKRGANLWREAHLGGTLWQDGPGLKSVQALQQEDN